MTTKELVDFVRDRAAVPKTTAWTDQKIVDAANEALRTILTDDLKRAAGEYLTDLIDIPVTAGDGTYPLPARSAGNTGRVLTFVDSNGVELAPLKQVEQRDIYMYTGQQGQPDSFAFAADGVRLLPVPVAGGTLRCRYTRRPGDLVLDNVVAGQRTDVGTVASVTAAVITLAAAHSGFPAGKKIDVTSAVPHFPLLAEDVVVSAAPAGTTITVSGIDLTTVGVAGFGGIQAGDYVTLQRKSFVPQLPLEWHDLLMLRTSAKMAHRLKDYKGAAVIVQEAMEMEKRLVNVAAPRGMAKRVSAWRGMVRNRHAW